MEHDQECELDDLRIELNKTGFDISPHEVALVRQQDAIICCCCKARAEGTVIDPVYFNNTVNNLVDAVSYLRTGRVGEPMAWKWSKEAFDKNRNVREHDSRVIEVDFRNRRRR